MIKKPETLSLEIFNEHLRSNTSIGSAAVLANMSYVDNVIEGTDADSKFVGYEIARARHQIERLSEDNKEHFYYLVRNSRQNEWLETIIIEAGKSLSNGEEKGLEEHLYDALINKKSNGRYSISNRTFVNFLEWHNYMIVQRQVELEESLVQLRQQYKHDISKAVYVDAMLPTSVLERLDLIDTVPGVIDDGIASSLGRLHERAVGSFDGSKMTFSPKVANKIIYSDKDSDTQTGKDVFYHEMTHALVGYRTSDASKDGYGAYKFGGKKSSVMMEEAVTEDISHLLSSGVQPSKELHNSADDSKSYKGERSLLAYISNFGTYPIPMKLFYDVYFESDGGMNGEGIAQLQLKDAIQQAFPDSDIFELLVHFQEPSELRMLTAAVSFGKENAVELFLRFKEAGSFSLKVLDDFLQRKN